MPGAAERAFVDHPASAEAKVSLPLAMRCDLTTLNLVLAVDNSGSMERADRVRILREALRVLATQLQPADKLSVLTFARTPRLWADGAGGEQAGEIFEKISAVTPEGGTNLEEAMNLAYATALRLAPTNALAYSATMAVSSCANELAIIFAQWSASRWANWGRRHRSIRCPVPAAIAISAL